ncbi:MAG: hypothetical protein R6V58_15800 [Planctomycetota bacterium]
MRLRLMTAATVAAAALTAGAARADGPIDVHFDHSVYHVQTGKPYQVAVSYDADPVQPGDQGTMLGLFGTVVGLTYDPTHALVENEADIDVVPELNHDPLSQIPPAHKDVSVPGSAEFIGTVEALIPYYGTALATFTIHDLVAGTYSLSLGPTSLPGDYFIAGDGTPLDDLVVWGSATVISERTAGAPVAEPGAAAVLLLGILPFARRRRR